VLKRRQARDDALVVRSHRSLRALMVDVPASYGGLLASHLEEAGWSVEREHADGADALSAALQRRGWNAVLYGGDGRGAVPARKALALVRLADPHLPFRVVSLRRRVGSAQHLLPAQQAIGDHLAAGLEPEELCKRVLATLGDSLGWTLGAVWRPVEDGSVLRCAAVWHAADAHEEAVAFARETQGQTFAPGQGRPGRVWAFRRPAWVPDVSRDTRVPRAAAALRAGLSTAVAFPLAVGDDCLGVIEFFTGGVHEHNGEVSAMFATVGGQLAQYLARHGAERDEVRGFLDAAGALIVVLDAEGRVQLANARACSAVGIAERELLGREWFELAPAEPAVTWLSTPLDGGGALLLGQAAVVAV
jgi:PAS domain-containing protein